VDAVPKINQSIEEVRERPNHIGKLTEEIVNSTSNLLSSIENMSRNKEER
jgi:hypothetical protein